MYDITEEKSLKDLKYWAKELEDKGSKGHSNWKDQFLENSFSEALHYGRKLKLNNMLRIIVPQFYCY